MFVRQGGVCKYAKECDTKLEFSQTRYHKHRVLSSIAPKLKTRTDIGVILYQALELLRELNLLVVGRWPPHRAERLKGVDVDVSNGDDALLLREAFKTNALMKPVACMNM